MHITSRLASAFYQSQNGNMSLIPNVYKCLCVSMLLLTINPSNGLRLQTFKNYTKHKVSIQH